MSNFIETYKQGKQGKNFGLTTGIIPLDLAINGIQKKTSIGMAAAPKVGKTTLADYTCVISPYLQMEKLGKLDDIEWIYLSGEIDRVNKEYKYAAFFMAYDFVDYYVTYKGKIYQMSAPYLMGKLLHKVEEDGEVRLEPVPVTEEHERMLKEVYSSRIIPLFGEWSADNKCIKKGKIIFIEDLENPTGLNKMLFRYAKEHGTFIEEDYQTTDDNNKKVTKQRIIGYTENNPDKFTIIITDHIRKLKRERGFSMKENIDKWLEYSTFLRNMCKFTFIHICHINRQIANVERLKYAAEFIYPTGDDVKDSGNLSEECTILLTMFNPNDEKYSLEKHFELELKDGDGAQIYPNYRSLHIVESRDTECPAHVQVNMFGNINMFQAI